MPTWLVLLGKAARAEIGLFQSLFRQTPPIDENKVAHIFRLADGHLPTDTPANRRLLRRVARSPANRLGTDRFGVDWAAQAMPNGGQVWVQVWRGRIVNGGVNAAPRSFDQMTGLAGERRKGQNSEQ